jgi:predicted porin
MKKSLLALAALGAFAGAASAQSSVTLSGNVDAGLRHTGTATGYDWGLAGSASPGNRFILRGSEDLGGGLRAGFWLEHRFRIQNGTNNSPTNGAGGADCNTNDAATNPIVPCVDPFYRRSFVSLANAFGEIRLGRQDAPLQEFAASYDPFAAYTVGSVFTGAADSTVRANSQVEYRTPNLGGLIIVAAIAEATGQNQGVNGQGEVGNPVLSNFTRTSRLGSARPTGIAFEYKAGPLALSGGWDRNAGNLKTVGLYGAYDFGAVRLFGQYDKGDNDTSSNPATAVAETVKAYQVGVTVPIGSLVGKLGAVKWNSDLANRDGSKVGVGVDYYLSKRTLLYSDIGKYTGNRFSVATKKAQFDLGVRHTF